MFIKNCWYVAGWDKEVPADGFLTRGAKVRSRDIPVGVLGSLANLRSSVRHGRTGDDQFGSLHSPWWSGANDRNSRAARTRTQLLE